MEQSDRTIQQPASLVVSLVVYCSPLAQLAATLSTCIQALKVAEQSFINNTRLLIIDNSEDLHYHAKLAQLIDQYQINSSVSVELRLAESNLGFGGGHNLALAESVSSDYFLILNPDIELDLSSLSVGLEFLSQNPDTALVCPRAENSQGQQEYLCKRYPSVFVLGLRGFAPASLKRKFERSLEAYELRREQQMDVPLDMPIASGCFMLTRASALRQIGGFDEGFFLYFEDFDLSLRLSKLGRVVYLPDMKVIHHGGYAASKGWRHIRLFVSSAWRFFFKHGWKWF